MKCFLRCFLLVLSGLIPAVSQAALPPLFPIDELKPGMHGKTLTVMQGTEIVELDTEILGVQKNALGPGKDLIIGKLVDEKTKLTEAVHGMSGSPLYIDGKLVGALSRRLGNFEKDGHCGFTPIKDMLDVGERSNKPDNGTKPFAMTVTNQQQLVPQIKSADGSGFLSLPLVISGWNERMQKLLAPMFPEDGLFMPVAGGSGSGNDQIDTTIKPGSPLAVVLMEGDFSAAGTGTVTTVDGDKVLAFGHSMLGAGAVEFPIAAAEIITVLPSYLMPYKISNTGKLVGTLKQDRLSAIAGVLGPIPQMAPYELNFEHNGEKRAPAKGHIVTDYRVAPQMIAVLAGEALEGGQDFSTNFTKRLSGEVKFEGLPPLQVDAVYSGDNDTHTAALFDMLLPVNLLYSKFTKQVKLERLNWSLKSYEKDSVWVVESVAVDRDRVKPLDTIQLIVRLKNDLGEVLSKEFKVKLNEQLKDGEVVVKVSAGADLQNEKFKEAAAFEEGTPAQLIKAMQREFKNDALYVQLLTYGTGVKRPDQLQPELPASIARVNRSNPLVKNSVDGGMVKVWSQQELLIPGVVSGSNEICIRIE